MTNQQTNDKIPFNYEMMIANQQSYSICSSILFDQEMALSRTTAFIEKAKLFYITIKEQMNLLQ